MAPLYEFNHQHSFPVPENYLADNIYFNFLVFLGGEESESIALSAHWV
jgi:hypothetical protein